MIGFLAFFLSVYVCMHAVVLVRVRVLLPEARLAQAILFLFLVVMVLAPIGTRLLERAGFVLPAQILAFTGYSWLGFTFIAFWVSLLTFAIDGVTRLLGVVAKIEIPSLSGKTPTVAMLCLVLAICVYAYIDAQNIRVERVQVKTEKLPVGMDRLKIAQISDVHLGLIVRGARLTSIVEKVRSENPDILVSTGDLVDGDIDSLNGLTPLLSDIHPAYGKFAVTGNHEVYAGLQKSIEIIHAFGFKLLHGEAVEIPGVLNVAGVDDPAVESSASEAALLTPLKNGRFTLLLKHRPQVQETSKGLFDLQLSGHSHRGQIFPFNFFTARVHPMQDGLYGLEKGSWLYTSRGTGTWGPPMRLLSPPEVTIVELTRK